MRAFIIRPFGVKHGVDFDAVDKLLIDPALEAQTDAPEGRTTGDIVHAGNIRTDMFEQILTADLVIADLSIHNANVFYELGIRHALRDKKTVLIRSRVKDHEIPFDLKTDRYLAYDNAAPENAVTALANTIRQTIASDSQDSPVFQLLPSLTPLDPRQLIVVPREFSEEVEHAAKHRDTGRLRLLAEEARGFSWEVAGLRRVGAAQFKRKDWDAAKESLEAVTDLFSDDVEANTLLGTVHQRRGDLSRSSLVLQRVLKSRAPSSYERAEVRALAARNAKTEWEQEWSQLPTADARALAALRSGYLEDCTKGYADAFAEDRNHFYSGVNALAMMKVTMALAEAHPEAWGDRFGDDDDEDTPARALRQLQKRADEMAAAVKLSAASGIVRLEREESDELIWARVSRADLIFLTSTKERYVAQAYREALAGAADFVSSAARKQVVLYEELGLFENNTRQVLALIPEQQAAAEQPVRVMLFTGHRLDAEGRAKPRFPADKESTARDWISTAVAAEKEQAGGAPLLGIGGGASGGDILFHEVCAELKIPTRMYLALPQLDYIAASVSDGGPAWVRRFNDLQATTDPRLLSDETDLPPWLRGRNDYSIWQRSNLWMLHTAFALGARVALIALWNRQAGDGPGGTQDMVERAQERGARVEILEALKLLD